MISTTVLPALKREFPGCEIGFLLASPAAELLQSHPFVDRVHVFDHWYANRRKGVFRAIVDHLRGGSRAIKEIRQMRYEIAIDLQPYFPNAIPLLFKAKIPVRIGYSTGGFSNLLTESVSWSAEYMGRHHLNLLAHVKIDTSKDSPLPNYIVSQKPDCEFPPGYFAVHMGTAHCLKEWDEKKWIELICEMQKQGRKVILTGYGKEEQLRCDRVSLAAGCLNYCNRLGWSDFAFAIQQAKLVISVDSVTVHLAAGTKTPLIVLFAGMNDPGQWVPSYSKCRSIMKRVPCAPCFERRGCSHMSCIRDIEVKEVLEVISMLC
ncbi:MAG: glycosyltransferase family 9 protein [Chlamydiales bacterium]|nr:glycosyltransferase family 9 protein [Chlamydiales bacterium]